VDSFHLNAACNEASTHDSGSADNCVVRGDVRAVGAKLLGDDPAQLLARWILWEVVSERGRLTLDNVPQRDLEAAQTAGEWKSLALQCVR